MSSKRTFREKLDFFIGNGLNIDTIISKTDKGTIIMNLEVCAAYGADIDQIADKLSDDEIARNLDFFLDHGADTATIIAAVRPSTIDEIKSLVNHGVSLVDIIHCIDQRTAQILSSELLEMGVNPYVLLNRIENIIHPNCMEALLNLGVDAESLVKHLWGSAISDNLPLLLQHGLSINTVYQKLSAPQIFQNIPLLLEHGAHINDIIECSLDSDCVTRHLETLLGYGANINLLAKKVTESTLIDDLDLFLSLGAKPEIILGRLR